jgi:hypothetical protein
VTSSRTFSLQSGLFRLSGGDRRVVILLQRSRAGGKGATSPPAMGFLRRHSRGVLILAAGLLASALTYHP